MCFHFFVFSLFVLLLVSDAHHITINYSSSNFAKLFGSCRVNFTLHSSYPQTSPTDINVFCERLSTEQLGLIQQEIHTKIDSLNGDSMLLELCFFINELFEELSVKYPISIVDNSGCTSTDVNLVDSYRTDIGEKVLKRNETLNSFIEPFKQFPAKKDAIEFVSEDKNVVTSVLHLDHMRSRSTYIKFIKKSTAELSLTGRLVFCRRYIFIVLQGKHSNIKVSSHNK